MIARYRPKMCYLYVLIFPNRKLYFGITNNVKKRFTQHLGIAVRESHLYPVYAALRKCSWVYCKVLCCSDADGTALSDVDWKSKDGHYSVFIENQWWDVPEEAVIKEPNRAGRTMVWPVYTSPLGGPIRVDIRCFLPGSMT